jgi:hypothetical protein
MICILPKEIIDLEKIREILESNKKVKSID